MSDPDSPVDYGQAGDDERKLRALTSAPSRPFTSDPYWQNLLVRTNRRVDDASGVKALSISWALRVAIPGVVAIIFFLIGLHYYVPQQFRKETSIEAVVLALSREAQDSLLTVLPLEDRLSAVSSDEGLFEPGQDQIAEYMIANGSTDVLIQTLTEQQFDEFLNGLSEQSN